MPVRSTKSRSAGALSLRLQAEAMSSSGRSAWRIICTARWMAARLAPGGSTSVTVKGWRSTSWAAMSSGSSRCTGPGFSARARRKHSRTRCGVLLPSTTCRVNLVTGSMAGTMSTI